MKYNNKIKNILLTKFIFKYLSSVSSILYLIDLETFGLKFIIDILFSTLLFTIVFSFLSAIVDWLIISIL